MSLIVITFRPPRVTVAGHRIHHAWLGVVIVLSDLKDYRVWLSDLWRRS